MALSEIWEILKLIGMTPASIIPLALVVLVLYIIFSKKLHNHLDPIKNAIVEIQTKFTDLGHSIKYTLTERRGSPISPTEYG